MIEFFLPNSRALLPTFSTICPEGSHFAKMGSHFAQNTSHHKPLSGICTNKKYPQPHPKTPLFLAWFWKWAKWTTVWAKWTPSGQNVWKCSRSVQKKFIHLQRHSTLQVSAKHVSWTRQGNPGLREHKGQLALSAVLLVISPKDATREQKTLATGVIILT